MQCTLRSLTVIFRLFCKKKSHLSGNENCICTLSMRSDVVTFFVTKCFCKKKKKNVVNPKMPSYWATKKTIALHSCCLSKS